MWSFLLLRTNLHVEAKLCGLMFVIKEEEEKKDAMHQNEQERMLFSSKIYILRCKETKKFYFLVHNVYIMIFCIIQFMRIQSN